MHRDDSTTLVVRASRATPAEWDAFATRAGGSFRCGFRAAVAWQFEHHWLFRVRRLDLFRESDAGGPTKIGQCAVGVGRRRRVFADGIVMLPEAEALWPLALATVVRHLGPGEYLYGSEWSLEPPREATLARIAGVSVVVAEATNVMTIEFARWPDFAGYLAAVSTNVRRNVKKAAKSYPSLRLDVRGGSGGVRAFVRASQLRRALFVRKGVRRSTIGMVVRSVARLLSLRRYSVCAFLRDGEAMLASYGGLTFGAQHAYLEGAADADNRGASWYLLIAMIERAFVASGGRGRFLMGSDDRSQGGKAWDGLRRSREQCCATPVPTSVVRFVYAVPTLDAARIALGPSTRITEPPSDAPARSPRSRATVEA